MIRLIIVLFFSICSYGILTASPALRGIYTYTQPDGTVFKVMLDGDEFSRKLTTLDGCYFCKGSDGYYYYARFDADGVKQPSAYRVGADAPAEVLGASRAVPETRLKSAKALSASRQELYARARERFIQHAAATKVGNGVTVHKVLVILAQFKNLKFNYTQADFENVFNKKGYNHENSTGSISDYFKTQLGEYIKFEFVVAPIVTVSQNYAYYGENDSEEQDMRPEELVLESCQLYSDQGFDFSPFDCDDDGVVDNIICIFAGNDEAHGASSDHIWAHMSEISSTKTFSGKKLGTYSMSAELYGRRNTFMRIGTACHELSHTLGLMDTYDTDYEKSGGRHVGMWRYLDIMDAGNFNNDGRTPPNYTSLELKMLGLGKETTMQLAEYILKPISGAGSEYLIFSDSNNKDEYFLFESRAATGWDAYIGGSGLLVYHIDMSKNMAGYSAYFKKNLTASERWSYNEVNANPAYPCAMLVSSNPVTYVGDEVQLEDLPKAFFPYSSVREIKPSTVSDYAFRNPDTPLPNIINIVRNGSNGEISFTVSGPLSIGKLNCFQDAAIVQWTTESKGLECEAAIIYGSDTLECKKIMPYNQEKNNYSVTFEGLTPDTAYRLAISLPGDIDRISVFQNFTTLPLRKSVYPFINLLSVEKNSDGSIVEGQGLPLRVVNAVGAKEIKWLCNGGPIKVSPDGYWPVRNGVLEAQIHYEDGSVDIIRKKLVVSPKK